MDSDRDEEEETLLSDAMSVDAEMSHILDLIGGKCSICFTEESDVELMLCGDQFCFECLEQYWISKLNESGWGLRPVVLDCPVCRTEVRDRSWLTWVGREMRELYDKMLRNRPILSRTCQECGHEQTLSGSGIEERLRTLFASIEDVFEEPLRSLLTQKLSVHDYTGILRVLAKHALRPHENMILFLRKILQCCRHDDPELFAVKQLMSVTICSGTFCDFCNARICLHCGETDWHEGRSCQEYFQQRLASLPPDSSEHATLKWKAQYGKNCPRCFLLITKDDDGGCNQMTCSYCGHSYCWECLREWSPACGYYRCTLTEVGDPTEEQGGGEGRKTAKHHREERTEAGIPDVSRLPNFMIRRSW